MDKALRRKLGWSRTDVQGLRGCRSEELPGVRGVDLRGPLVTRVMEFRVIVIGVDVLLYVLAV